MTGIIFKAIVGSHAYGTNIEGSDTDIKGVYIQDPEDVLINGYREQVEVSKDEVYYELRRFVELCSKANPTVLELLYSPDDCIISEHPIWKRLKEQRDNFLTKACKYSFGGYARDQITKATGLDKKMNWEKERTVRKTPLDFCHVLDPESEFNSLPLRTYLRKEFMAQEHCGLTEIPHFRYCYNLFYAPTKNYKGIVQKETSNDISLSEIPKHVVRDTVLFFNKDAYERHCSEYREYQEWLQKRNTQRYVDVEGHGQKIDGKNMLHCVRLLQTAYDIATGKGLIIRRPNAEFLIEIRKGKHDLQQIQERCRQLIDSMDKAFDESNLPLKVDEAKFKNIVVKMREAFRQAKTVEIPY